MYRLKSLVSHTAGIVALLGLFATSASANLIINGDFEAGNTGFTSEYANSPSLFGEERYAITTNPNINHGGGASYGDNTTGSGLMLAANGSGVQGTVIWSQTVAVASYDIYDFAAYVSSWSSVNPGELVFSINGVIIGGINAPSLTGEWELAFATWNSYNSTSATLEIRNDNTAASGNDFALDDLYFGSTIFSLEVPEPGTLAVFTLGLAGLAYTRRKKRS